MNTRSITTENPPSGAGNTFRVRRRIAAASLGLGLTVTLTACGSFQEGLSERAAGHTKTYSFDTGKQGKADKVLPDWVPDDATEVQEVIRTTGSERILTMRSSVDALPDTCEVVDADTPLEPRPEYTTEASKDFRSDSTLKATWWSKGQEAQSTHMCGAWWVGEKDGSLFAFKPERVNTEIEEQPDPS